MKTIVSENTLNLYSENLDRKITCTFFVSDTDDLGEPVNLLLLNDGQEVNNLRLKETLQHLFDTNRIKPLVVMAVHAGEERIQEYGVAGRPDFKERGGKAAEYTAFIIKELVPFVKKETGIQQFENVAFAGFSLGGLSAMDIAWNNPQLFNKTGVFSGSFWWRSKDLKNGYTDNDRIMHSVIRNTTGKPDLKFWLQTGTDDETADRNKNGIIDSLDDAIDIIKELEQKGYNRPADIRYLEMVGGKHNSETWAAAMPKFLCWAFGR